MSAGDRIRRGAKTPAGADKSAETSAAVAPFRRPKGRASYPHRLSIDVDHAQYEAIRRLAYDYRVSVSDLMRATIDLMGAKTKLRDEITAAAVAASAPPPPRSGA